MRNYQVVAMCPVLNLEKKTSRRAGFLTSPSVEKQLAQKKNVTVLPMSIHTYITSKYHILYKRLQIWEKM